MFAVLDDDNIVCEGRKSRRGKRNGTRREGYKTKGGASNQTGLSWMRPPTFKVRQRGKFPQS